MGKNVSYTRPDGKSVNGYLAEPKPGSPRRMDSPNRRHRS